MKTYMKTGTKIAIVEDDLDIQELVTAFFRPKGATIKIYNDAETLIKEMEKLGSCDHDVILTDLNLPTMSGIDFTKKSIEMGINTPIILITSQKSPEVALEAIQAGAYDFIVKPLPFPQLLIAVERALHVSHIRSENNTLKTAMAVKDGSNIEGIVGKSSGLLKAIDLAKRVASSNANVLLTGETGSGKEVIAKTIHHYSGGNKKPFIAINCSAIPENLLESELFGHAKGSFTGASDKKVGLFEEAEGGTLFLDEIGDLSMALQAKLLRVLQERKIKRIGENQMRDINVRVISATHKDLRKEVAEKKFREDLFFRLNVIPIALPPLRDRKEDIIPLAEFFLKKFSALNSRKNLSFSKNALESMLKNQWRGNVRELENTIERAVVLAQGNLIEESDVMDYATPAANEPNGSADYSNFDGTVESLESLTNRYIAYALRKNSGAKDKTAKELGIDRKTLYRRIQDLEKTNPVLLGMSH